MMHFLRAWPRKCDFKNGYHHKFNWIHKTEQWLLSSSGTDNVADCSKKTGEHCISRVD